MPRTPLEKLNILQLTVSCFADRANRIHEERGYNEQRVLRGCGIGDCGDLRVNLCQSIRRNVITANTGT